MAESTPPRKRSRKPAAGAGDVSVPPAADLPVVGSAMASTIALAAPAAIEPVEIRSSADEPVVSASSEVEAGTEPSAPAEGQIAPEVTAPATPLPASAVAEPLSEGSTLMATTYDSAAFTDATDKAKALFGEFNTRAKTAMEKSVKLGEEMTEFTKGNVEAIVASGRVAAKGAETIAQDVAETMKKQFESTTAQLKSLAAVKSPTELFQLQSDYAKTYFDGAVAEASKFSESMFKLWGDIAQPLSSRYALAAEKFKSSAL